MTVLFREIAVEIINSPQYLCWWEQSPDIIIDKQSDFLIYSSSLKCAVSFMLVIQFYFFSFQVFFEDLKVYTMVLVVKGWED